MPPLGVLLQGAPPSYFIVAGLVFTPATVPYLRSEYGKEYDYDAPVSTPGEGGAVSGEGLILKEEGGEGKEEVIRQGWRSWCTGERRGWVGAVGEGLILKAAGRQREGEGEEEVVRQGRRLW